MLEAVSAKAASLRTTIFESHFVTNFSQTKASTMVVARSINIIQHFDGEPKESDFKLVIEDLPPLKDGEVLAEALYWSVDPYMRVYIKAYNFPLGSTMMGSQIARVSESKHADFKVGDLLCGNMGWRTHSVVDIEVSRKSPMPVYKLPDLKGLSPSLGLGALGMPGCTAYFGFLELCQPKEGETVVVSGAAGAVGSLVGQIAKIKGCKVIGIAGSGEKTKWLEKELHFDKAINYKVGDVAAELRKAAPNGIDCYFDNVGGTLSSIVLSQMNKYGRVAVCGSISAYNDELSQLPQAPVVQASLVFKELKMEGFNALRWADKWMDGIKANAHWIAQGRLKAEETVTEGFQNIPKAFIGMLRGENKGKAVVKA